MLVDVVNQQPEIVATIDVFDTDNQVVAERQVLRFTLDLFSYQNIHLDFMSGREVIEWK